MKLDDLIAQRRILLDRESLLRPSSPGCLTLEQIETLAREGSDPDRPLCERCSSLLALFRELADAPIDFASRGP